MIKALIDEEVKVRGSADADLLHDHGCTFDTTGLPHHISSTSDIDGYVADVLEMLSRLKIKPKIITVAR